MGVTDLAQVLWEYLTVSGTTLHNRVGSRIWSPHLQKGFRNTEPAIVYWPEVEQEDGMPDVFLSSYWFRCYGGSVSATAARTTHRVLYDRLNNVFGESTTTGRIVSARFDQGQQLPPDPDTGWPTYLGKYVVEVV